MDTFEKQLLVDAFHDLTHQLWEAGELTEEQQEHVEYVHGLVHEEVVWKGAVASHGGPKAPEDRAWSGPDAKKRIAKYASSDGSGDKETIDFKKLKKGFAWVDSSEPELLGSYKLPHHDVIDGTLKVVWNGVSAGGGSVWGLMQGRGGQPRVISLPTDDIPGVAAHLARHYKQFDRVPPWKQEKVVKEGRVLSAKNVNALEAVRDLLSEGAVTIDDVLASAERRKGIGDVVGVVERPPLAIAEDETVHMTIDEAGNWRMWAPIIKVDQVRHVVTSHVLAANVVDLQQDFIRPEEIWNAMEGYMLAFQQVGVMHQEVSPQLKVVECWQAPKKGS